MSRDYQKRVTSTYFCSRPFHERCLWGVGTCGACDWSTMSCDEYWSRQSYISGMNVPSIHSVIDSSMCHFSRHQILVMDSCLFWLQPIFLSSLGIDTLIWSVLRCFHGKVGTRYVLMSWQQFNMGLSTDCHLIMSLVIIHASVKTILFLFSRRNYLISKLAVCFVKNFFLWTPI